MNFLNILSISTCIILLSTATYADSINAPPTSDSTETSGFQANSKFKKSEAEILSVQERLMHSAEFSETTNFISTSLSHQGKNHSPGEGTNLLKCTTFVFKPQPSQEQPVVSIIGTSGDSTLLEDRQTIVASLSPELMLSGHKIRIDIPFATDPEISLTIDLQPTDKHVASVCLANSLGNISPTVDLDDASAQAQQAVSMENDLPPYSTDENLPHNGICPAPSWIIVIDKREIIEYIHHAPALRALKLELSHGEP